MQMLPIHAFITGFLSLVCLRTGSELALNRHEKTELYVV